MEQLFFLGNDISKAVVKIEVPACYKREAMRELQQMNLHRASLFPDLDGYAASLKLRYDNKKTPQEIDKEVQHKSADSNYSFFP